MTQTQTDVLIVGGGAAGTMLSLELARHGVNYRTVDRLEGPAVTSKAITVHARTLEMLERIDSGLLERFLGHGIENKGYVLHFVDAAGRRSEVRPGLDFTTVDSKFPFLLVHGQSDTERWLREYLHAEYGRETEWSVRCTDVAAQADGITAALTHANGRTEQVSCRYLVACDGMNSFVRRSLALEQSEEDYAGTKMQNMDVFLKGFPDVEDYVHYCAGTDHFIMIVRLPGGFTRLLLSDRGEAADPAIEPKRAFGNLLEQHFDGVSLGDIVWHSKWESFVRLAKTYRSGRIFLAGDSAHVHSTTGGQGMNCCLQDAMNLGWKLGHVLGGKAPEELLNTYEAERRPIAEQVIWAASSLHEIFMAHGRDIAERAEKMNDQRFLDAVVGHCSGVDYTYRQSTDGAAPAAGLPGPQVGDRLIDALMGDDSRLALAGRGTAFALLGVYADAPAQDTLAAALAHLEARFPGAVVSELLPASAAFAARYGAQPGSQLLLVRPDGYLAGRLAAADWQQAEACLTGFLHPAV